MKNVIRFSLLVALVVASSSASAQNPPTPPPAWQQQLDDLEQRRQQEVVVARQRTNLLRTQIERQRDETRGRLSALGREDARQEQVLTSALVRMNEQLVALRDLDARLDRVDGPGGALDRITAQLAEHASDHDDLVADLNDLSDRVDEVEDRQYELVEAELGIAPTGWFGGFNAFVPLLEFGIGFRVDPNWKMLFLGNAGLESTDWNTAFGLRVSAQRHWENGGFVGPVVRWIRDEGSFELPDAERQAVTFGIAGGYQATDYFSIVGGVSAGPTRGPDGFEVAVIPEFALRFDL